eukprot:351647_1
MSVPICIRCGARDHTTRDHDEGKTGAGGPAKAAAPKAPSKKGTSKAPVAAPVKRLYTPVSHERCFKTSLKSPGIPELIDPPLRELGYKDLTMTNWGCRDGCFCQKCEKRRLKKLTDMQKRFGSKPGYTA